MSEQTEINADDIITKLKADDKKAKILFFLQAGFFTAGVISLITAIIFKVMGEHTTLIISFGLMSMLFFFGNNIVGKKVVSMLEKLTKVKDMVNAEHAQNMNQEAEHSKIVSTHNLDLFSDKKIEEKQMIDVVRAIKNFIIQIGEKSKQPLIGWSATVDLQKISEYMTYTDNGGLHYVVFAELTDGQKVDYLAHAKLLFIINDINVLKMLAELKYKKNSSNITEQALISQTRIILNACYLEHYMDAVEKHIALNELAMNQENMQRIYQETHNTYIEHLQNLANENDYLKKHIEEQINSGNFDNIPALPMGIGVILSDQTKQINNVYMTDEMYEQALNWMASMQAQAMANR